MKKTSEYKVDPIFDLLFSPIIVWVVWLFLVLLIRIAIVFFTGHEATISQESIDADIILGVLASVWHAWVWRKRAFLTASLVAAIEWGLLTTSAGYLFLVFIWSVPHDQALMMLKFWEGGLIGLLLFVMVVGPLIFGPVFGLFWHLRSQRAVPQP